MNYTLGRAVPAGVRQLLSTCAKCQDRIRLLENSLLEATLDELQEQASADFHLQRKRRTAARKPA